VERPALEVADIFRDFGPAWRDANRGDVRPAQLKVMSAIEACRTATLGGYVARCRVRRACALPLRWWHRVKVKSCSPASSRLSVTALKALRHIATFLGGGPCIWLRVCPDIEGQRK
jgi:hypothetical protein